MMSVKLRLVSLLAFLSIIVCLPELVYAQRRITPVNTPATATQPKNEFEGDTARINARKRSTMVHYHDDKGNLVYVDTVTGEEWRDSTTIKAKEKVIGNLYPLFESVTVGVNVFDPFMRMLGQNYGLGEVWAMLNLHNRYQPVVEVGLGQADNTPEDGNFTYSSSVSPYFRVGANYNFRYNSTPDYQFYAGLRFGLSSFSYKITDVSVSDGYWGEQGKFDIPKQSSTVFYYEVVLGCKVKLLGNISAGWAVRYHRLMSESGGTYGKAWYIPGFGPRRARFAASFTIMYTLPIDKRKPDDILVPYGDDPLLKPSDMDEDIEPPAVIPSDEPTPDTEPEPSADTPQLS